MNTISGKVNRNIISLRSRSIYYDPHCSAKAFAIPGNVFERSLPFALLYHLLIFLPLGDTMKSPLSTKFVCSNKGKPFNPRHVVFWALSPK